MEKWVNRKEVVLRMWEKGDVGRDGGDGGAPSEKCKESFPVRRIAQSTIDDEAMLFEVLNLHDELQQVISRSEEMGPAALNSGSSVPFIVARNMKLDHPKTSRTAFSLLIRNTKDQFLCPPDQVISFSF
ncbi:hypothetical protein LguiB_032132 [Lonicera macranthoides]